MLNLNYENLKRSFKMSNELSKRELQMKYYGSFFGVIWAFIHPVIIISILWFVFQVGFKSVPVGNVPFILWLVAGMVPWLFISDVLSNGVSAITENSFLVKKVVFKTELLPIVRIITALKIHLFFIVILFIIYFVYGYEFHLHNVLILYYMICSIVFLVGINLLTSSLNVFFKDTGQIIAIITQFGFWVTPIFWMLKTVPERYHFLIKLNPLYYIVEGYRSALFTNEKIFDHPNLTIYFWLISIVLISSGWILFKKLKPHFADVL
ncbi:ABC transporter permease [Paenibacillus sp. N3.4]|uniref:ABC transporter permease n=1 Tax=Paenibacillus sp. N3.4 TaxID=2603222 RepID=UPI0011C90CD1|nr:ABC transporter permease [Paenibacillus sp. N3.4]TXK76917.1 ABC transporter permease [Paenibacillus sp. N3.4]